METIFRNLIGNAIKFSKTNSTITINSSTNDNFIKIMVSDQGVGINSDRLGILLTDGSHNSTRGTNNEKGTGNGLGIVKKLVEKQKGSLMINSEVNEGTTVTISFPLVA